MSSPNPNPNGSSNSTASAPAPAAPAPAAPATATSTATATNPIDPATSIFTFTALTLVYFILKYLIPGKDTVLFIIYFIIVLVSQFVLNIYLAKQMCNNPSNVGTAFIATFLPWIFIFGLLNLALSVFPGWLSSFSNTIGYVVANIAGVATLFTQQLLNKGGAPNKDVLEVIQNMIDDPSLVFNTLNDDNVGFFWNNSIDVKLFNPTLRKVSIENPSGSDMSPLFIQLKNYIRLKNLVSYFIWYVLTGILITSISYNYMLSIPCVQTPKQARQSAAKFLADKNNAKQVSDAAKANAPVYKTDGR